MSRNVVHFVAEETVYQSSNSYLSAGAVAPGVTPAFGWGDLWSGIKSVGSTAANIAAPLVGCAPGDYACLAAKGASTVAKFL